MMKGFHEKQALEVFRQVQRPFSGCIGRGTSPQPLRIGKQEVSDDRPGLVRLGRGLDECTSADGSEQTNGAGHGMGNPLAFPQPCAGNFVEEPSLAKGRGRGAGRRAFDEILGSLREGVTPGAGRRAIDEMLGSLGEGITHSNAGGYGPDEMPGTFRESSLPSGKRASLKFSLADPKVDATLVQNASNNSSALVEKQDAIGELLQCSGKEHLLSVKLQVSEKIGMAGRGRGRCLVICEGPNSAILQNGVQLPEISSPVNLATREVLDKFSAFEVDSDNPLIAESSHKLESIGIHKEEEHAIRLCSGEVDVLCESEIFLDRGTYTSTRNECQSFGVPLKTGTGAERPSHAKAGGEGRGLGGFISGKRQANTPGLSRGQPFVPEKHFPEHQQKNGAGHGLLGKPDHNVSKHFSAILEKRDATEELLERSDSEPLRGMKLRVSQKIGMLGRGRGKSLVAYEGQASIILHGMQLPETADSVNAPNTNKNFTRQGLDKISPFEMDSDFPLVAESNHELESRENFDCYPTRLCAGEEDAFDDYDSLGGGDICPDTTDDMSQNLGEVKLESQEVCGLGRRQPESLLAKCSGRLIEMLESPRESSDGKGVGGCGLDGMLGSRRASISGSGNSERVESSLPDAKVDGGGKSSMKSHGYPRRGKEPIKLRVSEKIGMLGRGRGKSLGPNSITLHNGMKLQESVEMLGGSSSTSMSEDLTLQGLENTEMDFDNSLLHENSLKLENLNNCLLR